MKYLILLLISLSSFAQQARYFDEWRTQGTNDYVTVGLNGLRTGDGTDSTDKCNFANNGDTNLPYTCYDESQNAWVFSNDGLNAIAFGGGAGGINHIDNTGIEQNTDGYATYADTAGTEPVDGTGGSATVTFTRTTTVPLREVGMGVITKDAADRQGEGVGYNFSIDVADQGKMQRISFDYGTSSAYADADIRIFIYDVTGSILQRVLSAEDLIASSNNDHVAYFQASSSSTSYRLIFHVASTNASAYTVNIDNIKVGPVEKSGAGAFVSDWVAYTPTVTYLTGGASNVTHYGLYRRVGDSVEVRIKSQFSAASAAFNSVIYSMPPGLTIDSDKIPNSTPSELTLGTVSSIDTAANTYDGEIRWYTSTSLLAFSHAGAGTYSALTQASPFTFNSGDSINAHFFAPVEGWGTGIKPNEIRSGRDHTTTLFANSAQSLSHATFIKLTNWGTPVTNNSSGWDVANNRYVVQETGVYLLNAGIRVGPDAGNDMERVILNFYVNGVASENISTSFAGSYNTMMKHGSKIIELDKGDIVELYIYQENASNGSNNTTNGVDQKLEITNLTRLLGVIQPAEKIFASYTTDTATAIGTGLTDIPYEDLEYDTTGSMNTSTGIFTMPASRYCTVYAKIFMDPESYTASQTLSIGIVKNGTVMSDHFLRIAATISTNFMVADTYSGYFEKGDEIKIQASSAVATNVETSLPERRNRFTIICH